MNKIRMIVEGDAYEKFSEFLELGLKANELGFKFKVEHVDYIPDKGEEIVKQLEELNRKASEERSERFLRHAMRFFKMKEEM